jgi:hypothetical protein
MRQQPQKTKLGDAAEDRLFRFYPLEPGGRNRVMLVASIGQREPDVDVREIGLR